EEEDGERADRPERAGDGFAVARQGGVLRERDREREGERDAGDSEQPKRRHRTRITRRRRARSGRCATSLALPCRPRRRVSPIVPYARAWRRTRRARRRGS